MAANRARVVWIVCLACLMSFPAAAQNTGKTVRRRRVPQQTTLTPTVARAEAAMDRKDYAAAEQALLEATKQDEKNYRAWFDLGFVYNATGRAAEAIEAYRKSVAANPKIFESNLNLGIMLARAQSPDAEQYLRAATSLQPTAQPNEGLARAWVSLGHVIESRDPKQALAAFEKAAALHPKDPEPHLSAAGVAMKLNDLATAEKEFRAAAELDPKSAEAIAGLAGVYMKNSRLDEAEAALRKYLALEPQSAPAHVQLGRVLAALHRRPEAIEELEKGLNLAPDDALAQHQLAGLYLEDKQYAKAETLCRELLAKSPNNAELHHDLGSALLQQRKFADAQKELLTAVKLKPDLGEAYGDLALAASENQDYVLTIKALDARARLLPEMPATYFLRATAYDHLRAYKQAAENYHQFLLAANGKFPDQEWQARHRLKAIEPEKK